jgi:hypothetical protein
MVSVRTALSKPVDFGTFRKVIVAIDEFWLGVARLPGPQSG